AFLISVPFLPGAVGIYEGGIAGAFEVLGPSHADGVAYAMTIHAAELVVVAVGFLFLAHLGLSLAAPRKAAGEGAHCPRVRRVPRPAWGRPGRARRLTARRRDCARARPRPHWPT